MYMYSNTIGVRTASYLTLEKDLSDICGTYCVQSMSMFDSKPVLYIKDYNALILMHVIWSKILLLLT